MGLSTFTLILCLAMDRYDTLLGAGYDLGLAMIFPLL